MNFYCPRTDAGTACCAAAQPAAVKPDCGCGCPTQAAAVMPAMQPTITKPEESCGCHMQAAGMMMPMQPTIAKPEASCGCHMQDAGMMMPMQPPVAKPEASCGCHMHAANMMPMQPVTTKPATCGSPMAMGHTSHEACLCNMSLAMSYVLMQGWSQTYEPAVALARGTIFPELDLPFLAAGRNCR